MERLFSKEDSAFMKLPEYKRMRTYEVLSSCASEQSPVDQDLAKGRNKLQCSPQGHRRLLSSCSIFWGLYLTRLSEWHPSGNSWLMSPAFVLQSTSSLYARSAKVCLAYDFPLSKVSLVNSGSRLCWRQSSDFTKHKGGFGRGFETNATIRKFEHAYTFVSIIRNRSLVPKAQVLRSELKHVYCLNRQILTTLR